MSSDKNHIVPISTSIFGRNLVENESLDPNSIKLDSRDTSALLNYIANLSEQFWYYTEDDVKDGDWSDFFKSDLTCLLAIIAEFKTEQDYKKTIDYVDGVAQTTLNEDKETFLWQLFDLAFKSIFAIDEWYSIITKLHIHDPFHRYLKEIIWKKMTFALRDLYAYYYHAIQLKLLCDKEKINNLFKRLDSLDVIWNYNPFPNISKDKVHSYQIDEDTNSFLTGIKQTIRQLHDLCDAISRKAKTHFTESLSKGQTEPHIALLISFLKLYKHYQSSINDQVERHMDFYYDKVLDFNQRGANSDQAYLILKLKKETNAYLVSSKTSFSAGIDTKGQPIQFETDHPFLLTSSIINNYFTFEINRSNVLQKSFGACQVKSFDKPKIEQDTGYYQSFPVFGKGEPSSQVKPIGSSIGFAISSPELVLQAGTRKVQIKFNLKSTNPDSNIGEIISEILDKMAAKVIKDVVPKIVKIISKVTEKVLCKVLDKMINRIVDKSLPKIQDRNIAKIVKQAVNQILDKVVTKVVADIFSKIPQKVIVKNLERIISKAVDKIIAKIVDEVISMILEEVIDIQMTEKKGWINIDESTISLKNNQLKINFTIASGDNATANYSSKVHGKGYTTSWPILTFKISQSNVVSSYIYDWLNEFTLSDYSINANVSNTPLVSINTPKGKVSASAPFPPFGTNSTVGAQLIVGNYEAFIKNTSSIDLSGSWINLPSEADFENYYSAYQAYLKKYNLPNPQFLRQLYTCQLSWLDYKTGNWTLAEESTSLFPKEAESTAKSVSEDKDKATNAVATPFVFTIPTSGLAPDHSLSETLAYSDKSKAGFISVELTTPEMAFGNEIYPQVVAQVALENTTYAAGEATFWKAIAKWISSLKPKNKKSDVKSEEGKSGLKPMPNKPYIPKLKDVTISYLSESNIVPGEDNNHQLYCIHPFGTERIEKEGSQLLPFFSNSNYAFLGFEKISTDSSLTLFFSLKDSVDAVISEEYKPILFEVLGENGWCSVKVEKDDTYGLNKSGIVTLSINGDVCQQNTIMPLNQYWLRFSLSEKDVTRFNLQMIASNAVLVDRVINTQNQSEEITSIFKETIKAPIEPAQEIANVYQPFDSFGGSSPEEKGTFYQRVAQRLSHKKRLLSIKDVAKFVIENFSDVYETKIEVIKGTGRSNATLGIVPKVKGGTNKNQYIPVAPASLCGRILNEIEPLISSHLSINVEPVHFDKVAFEVFLEFKHPEQISLLKKTLCEDIYNFMSPWIDGNELGFTKEELYVNDVIAFILSRNYVATFDRLKVSVNGKVIYGNNGSQLKAKIATSDVLHVLVPSLKNTIIHCQNDSKSEGNEQKNSRKEVVAL